MLHNIKHNKVLHERNMMVTVITRDVPYVTNQERIRVEVLDDRFNASTFIMDLKISRIFQML